MINPNELRIGNLLDWRNPNDEKINPVRIDAADFVLIANENRGHDYHPIIITPEILLKCGFHKGQKWYIHQVFYIGQIDLCYNKHEIIYGEKTEHGFEKKSTNIKYVHQLQNLYFALTGEELIINL